MARRGLGPLLRFLRSRGVIPNADVSGDSPVAMLLAGYRVWLLGERGLAAEMVRCYLVQGGKFLADLPEPVDASLARLDAAAKSPDYAPSRCNAHTTHVPTTEPPYPRTNSTHRNDRPRSARVVCGQIILKGGGPSRKRCFRHAG